MSKCWLIGYSEYDTRSDQEQLEELQPRYISALFDRHDAPFMRLGSGRMVRGI